MPVEIFISYRRSDAGGHARYLYRELLQSFDAQHMFFDLATIESGDVFPHEIEKAVHECSVLLALIGPGWARVEIGGRPRLHDPVDFVRNEIAIALAEGKCVIPVLLDSAQMPSSSELPDVLTALADRDAHTQGGKSAEYDTQLQRLAQLLAQTSGVSPPRAQAARNAPGALAERDKLPVLCDRSPQDEALGDTLRSELRSERRRPIVLVLHGRADEEHHAFVERLEGYSLPRLLKGSVFGQGVQFVRINDPMPIDAGQIAFDHRMREKLADALDVGWVDDDATLLRQMAQLKLSTVVAIVTWRASELASDPALPLQRVFDYWANFPPLGARALAGCIVCVKYDRSAAGKGFLARLFGSADDRTEALRRAVAHSAELFGSDRRVAWCVASELPSITVADLDRWVADVARLVGRFSVAEERLQAIIGGDARPMQAVLPELGKLLATP